MATYEVFVDDDRYSVPSLYLVTAAGHAQAEQLAEKLWRDSDHHRGVELRLDGLRLYAAGTCAVETGAGIEVRQISAP